MHFKLCVSYILREFIAQSSHKLISEVTPDDFTIYARMSASSRGDLINVVNQIFDILFQNPPKTQEIADFVGCWIRKSTPLILVRVKIHYLFSRVQ